MFLLKPARSPEHLLRINASQAVTPIHAERVRKLVPLSNDASVNLNPFCYLPKKVQAYVDQQPGVRVQEQAPEPTEVHIDKQMEGRVVDSHHRYILITKATPSLVRFPKE